MAQHKYDLVTVPTQPAGPPRHHPWYKERLDLKFTKHGRKSGCLDGRKWTLLAGNMDDFRTGLPALTDNTAMIMKRHVDSVPLVDSSRSLVSRQVGSGQRQRARSFSQPSLGPGRITLHSKVGPRRQSKLAHLKQLEEKLLQSPLSLYPHLRDSIPSEISDDVLAILDTGKILKTSAEPTSNLRSLTKEKRDDSPTNKETEEAESEVDEQDREEELSCKEVIYRWPLRQTEEEVIEEQRAFADQKVISPAQEAKVNDVTHNLVQWGRDLGGSQQTSDIDETTVKSLFTSDYENETKLIKAPLNVVEFPNVPLELLQRDTPRLSTDFRRSSLWVEDDKERGRSYTAPGLLSDTHSHDRPRYIKSRYGAWYLPIYLWKQQRTDEPLRDPRNMTSESTEELARQDEELNYRVSQLHGTQAFRDYYSVHRPGLSVPSFLQSVAANTSSQL